jgi:hypothetical protein
MTDFDVKQMGIDMGICPMCNDHMPCGCDNGIDDFDTHVQADELDSTEYELWEAYCKGDFDDVEEVEDEPPIRVVCESCRKLYVPTDEDYRLNRFTCEKCAREEK